MKPSSLILYMICLLMKFCFVVAMEKSSALTNQIKPANNSLQKEWIKKLFSQHNTIFVMHNPDQSSNTFFFPQSIDPQAFISYIESQFNQKNSFNNLLISFYENKFQKKELLSHRFYFTPQDFMPAENGNSIAQIYSNELSLICKTTFNDDKYVSSLLNCPFIEKKKFIEINLKKIEEIFRKPHLQSQLQNLKKLSSIVEEIENDSNKKLKQITLLQNVLKEGIQNYQLLKQQLQRIYRQKTSLEKDYSTLQKKNTIQQKELEKLQQQLQTTQKEKKIIKKKSILAGLGLFFTGLGLHLLFNHFNLELNAFLKQVFSAILEKK